MADLSEMKAGDEPFDAKVKVLGEGIDHPAGEEEEEMFPCFDELDQDDQNTVSEALRDRKIGLTDKQ